MAEGAGIDWGTLFGTVIGSGVGVIAGLFIQPLIDRSKSHAEDRTQRSAYCKELQYNDAVLVDLQNELTTLRHYVNGAAIGNYIGYFEFSRADFTLSKTFLQSGKLYAWLDIEQIRKIQRLANILGPASQSAINGTIDTMRSTQQNNPEIFSQGDAVNFVQAVEKDLSDARLYIKQLLEAIK